MENIIIQILNILVQSVFISYYIILTSNCTEDKKKKFSLALLFTILANTLNAIVDLKQYGTLISTLVSSIAFMLILKFTIKPTWVKSIILVSLYYVLIVVTEIITFYLFNLFLHSSSEVIMADPYKFIIFIVCQHIIAVIFLLTYKILIDKNYKLSSLTFKNSKILLIMIIGCILPQVLLFTITNYSYPLPLLITSVMQIILVSGLIFLYIRSSLNKEKIEAELITTELHNKTLIEIVDSVRTLKHDYGNIVQALNGYVITKQYEQLDEYVNSLLKEFDNVNNVSSIDPKIINEPAIYGVVGAKYFFATENEITFELDITSNIKEINFPKPELSRIFGILLDNAIEATQKAKEKYIKLEIYFDEKKYANIIKIINTYDTSISIDLNNIYEKGISSKKVKSGIGLWEVKKLVKKNKHSQIYATIEKDKFIQNLIIEKAE